MRAPERSNRTRVVLSKIVVKKDQVMSAHVKKQFKLLTYTGSELVPASQEKSLELSRTLCQRHQCTALAKKSQEHLASVEGHRK